MDHNEVYQSLLTLIKWSRQHRKNKIQNIKNLKAIEIAKEWSTIKFCLPRQSGHSYMIKRLIGSKGFFNRGQFQYPVIILPHQSLQKEYSDPPPWATIHVGTNNLNKLCGNHIDGVIIDCASLLLPNQIDNIYNFFSSFAHQDDFLFLFME